MHNIRLTNIAIVKLKNGGEYIFRSEINNKIGELSEYFESFEGSRNKIIVLGSIDYMRIALREANLTMM